MASPKKRKLRKLAKVHKRKAAELAKLEEAKRQERKVERVKENLEYKKKRHEEEVRITEERGEVFFTVPNLSEASQDDVDAFRELLGTASLRLIKKRLRNLSLPVGGSKEACINRLIEFAKGNL